MKKNGWLQRGCVLAMVCLGLFWLGTAAWAGSVRYVYDSAGRLVLADYGTKAIAYTYDKNGNLLEKKISDVDTCPVTITGYTTTGTLAVGSPITFSVSAKNSCSTTQNFRFSFHPDYGTSGYDGTQWTQMTSTEYQTGNTCTHTFTKAGRYIVVVWVVKDTTSVTPTEVPVVGWSLDISDAACKTNIIASSITGDQTVNTPITLSVTGENSCSKSLSYRFSFHPDYGTTGYDNTQWKSMTTTEWVTDGSATYTFTQRGKYIVVVWAVDDTANYDAAAIPITGWSLNIR